MYRIKCEKMLESITEKSGRASKLRVLDFDDTIAHTVERVRVDYPGGHKMISSEDFADYNLKEGEYFHPELAFEEFKSINVDQATPVPFVSDLLKKFVEAEGDRNILILTARGDEVQSFVMEFLRKKLGIDNPEEKVLFKGVASKEPVAKVKVIFDHVRSNPDIKFISFFDDSGSNVKAVRAFIDVLNTKNRTDKKDSDEIKKIGSDIRQVVEDEEEAGKYYLEKPTYEPGEEVEYREMIRNFLSGEEYEAGESSNLDDPDETDESVDLREMTRWFFTGGR